MITYAIGDIHGQRKELQAVLTKCISDVASRKEDAKFVFVGDYIDRGPDSRGVIDCLINLSRDYECVFLRGNHEDMLMNDWHNFLGNGGMNTLRSYGWHEDHSINPYVADLARKHFFSPEHLWFFENTKLWHKDEKRTYVHAGINRSFGGVEEQPEPTLLWIRQKFLLDPRPDGGYVVHGHTPLENGVHPCLKPNRVNIDTGSVFQGRLTAAIFDDSQEAPIGFIQDRDAVDGRVGEEMTGGIYVPQLLIDKANEDE